MHLTDTQLDEAMTAALRTMDAVEFSRLGDIADQRQAARSMRLANPGALAAAAAWYAQQGVAIFPVEQQGKVPMVRWRDVATADVEQVAAWWARWPRANIGMPTGLRWDVIDIDGPRGYQSYGLTRERGQVPPVLGRSATPRGGMHVFIAPTGDGNAANFIEGVDYRGLGGYVVIPPSVGANTHLYEWLEPAVAA